MMSYSTVYCCPLPRLACSTVYFCPLPRLAGCYEALVGGQTGDALVDFTGGVSESVDIHDGGYQNDDNKQVDLFENLFQAHKHKSLISCSIAVSVS